MLVKGPPGTGKSHTIANLICHLLAKGERILITAKKPRALQVLQGLLPEELRPLCISLLGNGPEERRALEASVNGILNQRENWESDLAEQQLNDREHNLRTLKDKKAEIDLRIRAIRESETHPHTIAEGAYRGTAARIAQAVNRDRAKYNWFKDDVRWDENWPRWISTNHLQSVLAALRRFTLEMREELRLAWLQTLPSAEYFANLVQNERSAIQEEQSVADGADEQLADLLGTDDPPVVKAIRNAFSSLRDARKRLSASPFSWMNNAVHDVLGGNLRLWHEILRVTGDVVNSVENLVATADETTIEFPDTRNIILLRDDARTLKEHIENGGKLGWGPFRPKPVRDRLYVIKDVKINGHPCSTVEHFTSLAYALYVRIECEKAWDSWEGQIEGVEKKYAFQLVKLKDLRDALEDALALEERIAECSEAINQCAGIVEPTWADKDQIEKIISSCRLALARNNKQRASEEINRIENSIAQVVSEEGVYQVTNNLLNAIRSRNTDEFTRCANMIQDFQKIDESLSQLRDVLPQFTTSMEQTWNEAHWEERIEHIGDAWHWRQARHWIEDYIYKGDVPALNTRAKQIEDDIKNTIAELASLNAWSHCFSLPDPRLQEHHCQHMVAWQQAMGLFGAGQGIHAAHHLHVAQRHLNQCREAVPAWVMPLHRVWDTVTPAPEIFDVVIVDEASQCGIEALPLFYLAKKIVIVGDDKQISPDTVGLDQGEVHHLMAEFLHDVEFGDMFHIRTSLFDHGRRLYAGRQITLREHFRCMPEIIRFSNELCYADTWLIPLRQYGSDRLPPLEHVFVGNGYAEEIHVQKINRPEAERVVEKIAEICDNEQYDGKTMGVIVLQGIEQAKLIERQLLEHLGAEVMEERRLVCGNPSSFQGDERDIMFLSLVVANNLNFNALRSDTYIRRFNVAASRARDQMILFHSVTCDNLLDPDDLRRKLLDFFQNTQPQQIAGIPLNELEQLAAQGNQVHGEQPSPFESWFEVDVALELLHANFRVLPQYEVAGYRIDLVVDGGQARLAVECDGDRWHGPDRYDADMRRQRQLERCGWEFFRVRASTFYFNKKNALAGLWPALKARGIFPG